MKIKLKQFLLKICIFAVFIMGGAFTANAASNLGTTGDVGDFGTWSTPHNQTSFKNNLTADISSFGDGFQKKQLAADYVPIEAKVGRAFVGGLSAIGTVLENSLVRFISVFMIILLIFWIALETYNMMKQGGDVKKLTNDIVKKLIMVSIWILVIEQGPARLFMLVMGPVITIGTYLSDMILNAVSAASGANLPDTCAAIHKYVAANHTGNIMIDADATASILCVPTRLSGFFYTAVSAGWQWMIAGIGTSAFTFTVGAVFVVIFIYNIWKFALMSFGVIADLFLIILMLPFTALAETFGDKGKTSYDGMAGNIFNQFLGLFKAQTLETQVGKFINVALYFVSLSIVIALCAAILSGVIDSNLMASVPTLENDGFMQVLIVGCLVAYLATKAGEIAGQIGGKIDDSLGKQVGGDIKSLGGNATKTVKSWIKIIRKK